jgi:hypothetical protein
MSAFERGDLVRATSSHGAWFAGTVVELYAYGTIARVEVTDIGTAVWEVGARVDIGTVRLTKEETST